MPVELWIELLHKIQKKYPDKFIFITGAGDYAVDFCEAFAKERWYFSNYAGKEAIPFIFCIVDYFKDIRARLPLIPAKFLKYGTLTPVQGALPNQPVTFRAIAALASRAGVVIGPDSALSHTAAALDVPCISLFTAFDPAWRISTYPKNRAIYHPDACPEAPCSWHEAGFPPECPVAAYAGLFCKCAQEITADEVMENIVEIFCT